MRAEKSAGTCFLKPFFHIRENFFQSFLTKFLSLLYMRSLDYKISHCLSAYQNPELRCVICTGVTLFSPVLHFLHWCYTWTALLSANQNRVIFSCVFLIVKTELINLTQAWDKEKIWVLDRNRRAPVVVFGMSWFRFLSGTQIFFFVPHSCHVVQFTFHISCLFLITSSSYQKK